MICIEKNSRTKFTVLHYNPNRRFFQYLLCKVLVFNRSNKKIRKTNLKFVLRIFKSVQGNNTITTGVLPDVHKNQLHL